MFAARAYYVYRVCPHFVCSCVGDTTIAHRDVPAIGGYYIWAFRSRHGSFPLPHELLRAQQAFAGGVIITVIAPACKRHKGEQKIPVFLLH